MLQDENSDFEVADPPQSWTASGGTFVAETSSPLFGDQSGRWDSSASAQTLDSTVVAIPVGLQENLCEVKIQYLWDSGASGDLELKAYDGTNDIAVTELDPTSGAVTEAAIQFTCPTSGNLRLRLESTVANPAEITVDNAFVGEASTIKVGAAEIYGSITYHSQANCFPSETSATYADLLTDSDCFVNAPTVSGNAVAPTDDNVAIEFNSLPPGEYYVEVIGDGRSGSTGTDEFCSFRLHDGTTAGSQITRLNEFETTDNNITQVTGTFSYPSGQSSSIQIRTQVMRTAGSSSCGWVNSTAFDASNPVTSVTYTVWRYPLSNSQALNLNTQGWHIDANIGGANLDLGTSDVTSPTEITNGSLDMVLNTGSKSAEIPCSGTNPSTGLTCAAGSEGLGVVFEAPSAGKYEVCFSFNHFAQRNTSGIGQFDTTFELVETPNNAQTILQRGNVRMFSGGGAVQASADDIRFTNPHHLCGYFTFGSAGQKTIRTVYEQDAQGTVTASLVIGDRAALLNDRDIHVLVRKMTEGKPLPVIFNTVSSPIQNGVKMFGCRIDYPAGVPTIAGDTSLCTWIDSIDDDGTGDGGINVASGTCSGEPVCTINPLGNSNRCGNVVGAISSTEINFEIYGCTTGTLVDNAFFVQCHCAK